VVDDVIRQAAAHWIRAAQRIGVRVASLHDLGLGCLDADLVIDGSVTRNARVPGGRGLLGPRYAVVNPVGPDASARVWRVPARRVLVALGGGPRRRLALAIARVVVRAVPGATVRIAGGFGGAGTSGAAAADRGIRWTGVQDGLGREFAACDVAVVAGGVSLYEACAAGVPSVALPVVTAQVPTVLAFARRGACVGVGRPSKPTVADAVGRAAASLLAAPASRVRLSTRARRLVDGEGARRVASAVWALAGRRL
jgi:UDP-2,4-diacetamido-2,4,6-trideoxy-beta-L-altropyranose hydrolase